MLPIEIHNYLRERPFTPVRLHMSDGSYFDVRHPEMAIVTATLVYIPVYDNGAEDLPRVVRCDPVHVTRPEPLKSRPAAPGATEPQPS
jgi:hypothetical protein